MSETIKEKKSPIDILEKGALRDGQPQTSDRRLFCQLLVFTGCRNTGPLIQALKASGLEGVLYADVNDPRGVGLLLMSENPAEFATQARDFLLKDPFNSLTLKPEFTLLGRTYSSGFEPDLVDWLLRRPRRYALNPEWPWAVWYPLRRKPEFELLPKEEQRKILMEHATIGREFGEAGFAYDIRLACHGIDRSDNEFVIGLVGKELYPLSRLVQEMRRSQQTAKYIQSLGPFFVGRVLWQSSFSSNS